MVQATCYTSKSTPTTPSRAHGLNYTQTRLDVVALKEEINQIFNARTKRTARRRYEKVLAQRSRFVTGTPRAGAALAFLERHWPYLAVFEKVYHFTPFSDDAQERIRGKCPLELAGYEVPKLPMAQLFRGLALQWPASAFQEFVPNV